MKIDYNTPVTINLGDMSHVGMSHEEMVEYYLKNSSPAGFLMESVLAKKFDNLELFKKQVKCNGITINPDLKNAVNDDIIDQKTVNHKGCNFVRSKYKGAGRKVAENNKNDLELWVTSQSFIFTDIRDLPDVRVVLRRGQWLIDNFDSYMVHKDNISKLYAA